MALATGGAARAAVSVIGGGMAEACSQAALAERSDYASILTCDTALETEDLGPHDRAGTFVNRGVMKLRRDEFEPARADFDAAITLAPKIGEAYVNRGAAFLGEKRFQAGLDDINAALRLGVREPEKAYFNRALAYEGLDDEKSAYLDFQQALTLKPGWALPEHELLRFTVSRR
jgi:tetratricopeptide (TPR) repeat protein